MSTAVQSLIESFDALSDVEKRDAAVAIVGRVCPVNDETAASLVETAEALFTALGDERERAAAAKLARIRLDKDQLKRLAQTSPPPASWYEDDTRCW